MNQNKVLSVRNLVLIAMFSALAAVLETIQVGGSVCTAVLQAGLRGAPGTDRRLCHGTGPGSSDRDR